MADKSTRKKKAKHSAGCALGNGALAFFALFSPGSSRMVLDRYISMVGLYIKCQYSGYYQQGFLPIMLSTCIGYIIKRPSKCPTPSKVIDTVEMIRYSWMLGDAVLSRKSRCTSTITYDTENGKPPKVPGHDLNAVTKSNRAPCPVDDSSESNTPADCKSRIGTMDGRPCAH